MMKTAPRHVLSSAQGLCRQVLLHRLRNFDAQGLHLRDRYHLPHHLATFPILHLLHLDPCHLVVGLLMQKTNISMPTKTSQSIGAVRGMDMIHDLHQKEPQMILTSIYVRVNNAVPRPKETKKT